MYSHNSGDDEQPGAPDEEDGEHGEADVLGLLVVAPHVPGHVAVGSAEDHQQEVVPLQGEERGDALLADLEVAVARVHVNQVSSVTESKAFSLTSVSETALRDRKHNMAAILQI